MQHPQAHTEVTIWHKGATIPEQEAARTRACPTASSSLPSWDGQTSMVSLNQPNLHPCLLTLPNSGASVRGSICPTGSLLDDQAPWPVTCEQTASQGSRGALRGQTQARAKGTHACRLGCLHTALKCQSTGKGSMKESREKGVTCRGCAESPGAAMHSTGGEAAPSLWLQHPGEAVCCTELDSSSVGMSSLLPGQCCDHITLPCSDSVLPSKPQGSASLPKQCSGPVLAPTAAVPNVSLTALVCRVNTTTCTHSHTWAPAKRHSGLSRLHLLPKMFLWRLPSHPIIGCGKLLAIGSFR